jgi:putative transposase
VPKNADRSLLRLSIRVGEIVVRDSRLVRIEERLDGDRVKVCDLATGESSEVSLSNLRGRSAVAEGASIDAHLELTRASTDVAWRRATSREQALGALFEGSGPWGQRANAVAKTIGITRRTLYRWLARYRDVAATSSLVPLTPGVPRGARRLDVIREALVNKIIEQEYLSRSRPTVEEIVRKVERRCVELKYKSVSRNAIRLRIQQLDPRTRTRTRYGAKVAHSKHASTPGSFLVEHILQSVQIDHALADVIVVDERDRIAIGRPWITLAIDVFSRGVLGFYVSLDPPSVTSIGMCLTQGCLPKEPWLLARGLSHLQWPLCGLMDVLRADNGRDFRSEPLRRGCLEHNIDLDYRPVATPHFGGHIERLIGTMMGRIHLLPGTTFANPRERKGYPSEQKAAMTLSEFEHWLSVEMSERYHRDTHRGLGATPLGTWEHDMSRGISLEIPADPKRFRISFLPMEKRILQRNGLQLFNLRYWSDALPSLVRQDAPLLIRYDPRDLSKLYVKAPEHSYLEVPYADIRLPPVSVWELRAARRFLAQRGDKRLNQERLFWAHAELQRIVAKSVNETSRVRRQRGRREALAHEQSLAVVPAVNSATTIDYSKPARDLPIEIGIPKRRS